MSMTRHEVARIRAHEERELGECDPAHCEFCEAEIIEDMDVRDDLIDQEISAMRKERP